jgi:ketosteroid isomerase-like protein
MDEDLIRLAGRLEELEDRLAVAAVYTHYAWLLDSRDWARVADEIFAADGELNLGTGMPTEKGRDAIRAAFDRLMSEVEGTAHYFTNVDVHVHGGRTASARAYFQSFHWSMDTVEDGPMRGIDFLGSGVYLDELRKDPEGWRILRRRRRNLGPGPLGLGTLPPSMTRLLQGWGGSPDA